MSDLDYPTILTSRDHDDVRTIERCKSGEGVVLTHSFMVTKSDGNEEMVGNSVVFDPDSARALLAWLMREYPIDALGNLSE